MTPVLRPQAGRVQPARLQPGSRQALRRLSLRHRECRVLDPSPCVGAETAADRCRDRDGDSPAVRLPRREQSYPRVDSLGGCDAVRHGQAVETDPHDCRSADCAPALRQAEYHASTLGWRAGYRAQVAQVPPGLFLCRRGGRGAVECASERQIQRDPLGQDILRLVNRRPHGGAYGFRATSDKLRLPIFPQSFGQR
jgi:hypothetical protein